MHPDDRAKAAESIKLQIIKNKAYDVIYRIVDIFGKIKWVIDRGCAKQTAKESFELTGILIDITDIKQNMDELRQKSFQLTQEKKLQQEKIDRLSDHFYRINNILATVNSNIMVGAYGREISNRLLNNIIQIRQSFNLIDEIIKKEQGSDIFEDICCAKNYFSILDVIITAIENVVAYSTSKGVNIFKILPDENLTIQGSFNEIENVFTELIKKCVEICEKIISNLLIKIFKFNDKIFIEIESKSKNHNANISEINPNEIQKDNHHIYQQDLFGLCHFQNIIEHIGGSVWLIHQTDEKIGFTVVWNISDNIGTNHLNKIESIEKQFI
jgi:hypothetical protein